MQKRIVFGVPAIPMTEAVDMYLSLQENVNRNHLIRYRTSGRLVWNEMLKNTIWSVLQVRIPVNATTKTFQIPSDVQRLFSITIEDNCGKQRPIFYDATINTLKLKSNPKSCSCSSCGTTGGTLCPVFETVTYTDSVETIFLNGQEDDYRIRKYIVKDATGKVTEITEYYGPQGGPDADTLAKTTHNVVCELEVDENGCVCDTLANQVLVEERLNCYRSCATCMPSKQKDMALPAMDNGFGQYTEIEGRPGLMKLTSKADDIRSVMISYQSTGENLENIQYMVPEYALLCFMDGLRWMGNRYVGSVSASDKEYNERQFNKQRVKLMKYMYPISIEEFYAINNMQKKW